MSILLAFVASPAFAVSNEIDLQLAWLGANDPRWDSFSGSNTYATGGLRVGYALTPRLAAVIGWQHGVDGVVIDASGGYADEDQETVGDTTFKSVFFGDRWSLGLKGDVALTRWFHPYATLSGAVLRGLAKLDEEAGDDDNLNQLKGAGLTGGGEAALGVEFQIRVGDKGRAVAFTTELGYGLYAPVKLGDFGAVQFDGFAGRVGTGVRF